MSVSQHRGALTVTDLIFFLLASIGAKTVSRYNDPFSPQINCAYPLCCPETPSTLHVAAHSSAACNQLSIT